MAKIVTEKKFRFEITGGQEKKRLDLYLTNSIEHSTRTRIQKLFKAGLVLANGEPAKPNYKIVPGDIIEVTIPVAPRPDTIEPEEIPLDITYEDEDLMVINKPPGIVVHPALGNHTGTLVNALLHHTNKLSSLNEDSRAGIVHRIDKDTSGLLLIAKDEWVHSELAKQFAEHSIDRTYCALAWGLFPEHTGEIIGNIGRSKKDRKLFAVLENEGKHAHTFYKVIEEFDFATLLELKLKTGRTHQIRVHLSHINHAVFGDHTYGGRRINYGLHIPQIKGRVDKLLKLIDRQALHAKTLGFYHPVKKERMVFDSELPGDMQAVIGELRKANVN